MQSVSPAAPALNNKVGASANIVTYTSSNQHVLVLIRGSLNEVGGSQRPVVAGRVCRLKPP